MKYPQAIGPYSPYQTVGETIYFSGQIGLNPDTMELIEGLEGQTKQVCENISGICYELGISLTNICKTTIYLANIEDFITVNEIYGTYFSHKPARSTIAVKALPKGALVEIECIAYK
ncbi:Rid family detoxifying hydrolase [Candidatus Gracilibacteria bacterium]|nr:Rid family detoxifying hydrolase [Candidatus Gracilibacteria bacterium]